MVAVLTLSKGANVDLLAFGFGWLEFWQVHRNKEAVIVGCITILMHGRQPTASVHEFGNVSRGGRMKDAIVLGTGGEPLSVVEAIDTIASCGYHSIVVNFLISEEFVPYQLIVVNRSSSGDVVVGANILYVPSCDCGVAQLFLKVVFPSFTFVEKDGLFLSLHEGKIHFHWEQRVAVCKLVERPRIPKGDTFEDFIMKVNPIFDHNTTRWLFFRRDGLRLMIDRFDL
jgi:hypothetical protein